MRRTLGGVATALTIAMLAGCGGGAKDTASTPTRPATAHSTPAASATPTPSATHPTGRNLAMTDAEALARMTDPLTGEHWFGSLRRIPTPAWATSNLDLGNESTSFFELGTRGAATIVGVTRDAEVELIFECGADGACRQIDYPSPRESAATADGSVQDYGVPHDQETYYDSFAAPDQLTLPSGDPVSVSSTVSFGVDPAGSYLAGHANETSSSAGRIGGFEIVRYDSPGDFVWTHFYPKVAAPPGLTFVDWYYMLRTPWGTEKPLGYDPFGTVTDVTWDAAHPVPAPNKSGLDESSLVDLNDSGCGTWARDRITVVRGLADNDWVPAGIGKDGRKVYLPTKSNPLLATFYALYSADTFHYVTAPDGSLLSQEAFLLHPALVGYKTPSSGSWVVFLNADVSARAWC